MTARGVKFLDVWISQNVEPVLVKGDVLIRALAQKLRDDASAAGLATAELEIDGPQIEKFIRETIGQALETAKLSE